MQNTFGIPETTWLYLDRISILFSFILMLITLIGYIWRNDLRRWLKRNQFPEQLASNEHSHCDGVIFTLSREEVPRWVITQIQPKIIGLLVTQSELSQKTAESLKKLARQQNILVHLEQINDPDDPFEAKRKTQELLLELQQAQAQHIAVDITGGKTPMSLGAFMAAEEAGAGSLYVTTEYKNNQPDMSTAQIKTITQTRH